MKIRKLTYMALSLALCMILPLFTGQIPQIGKMLLPMHIPVLLCGFLCGPLCGLAVGLLAPICRFLLFGVPTIFPTGLAMTAELGAYGLLAGWLYGRLPKKTGYIYIALFGAMTGGRLIWGAASFFLAGMAKTAFPFSAFLAGAVTEAFPGIALQFLLVPPIVIAVKNAEKKSGR